MMLFGNGDTSQQRKPQEKIKAHKKEQCVSAEKAIVFYRGRVWSYQRQLDEQQSPTYYPERRKHACKYKRLVASNWQAIAAVYHKLMDRLETNRAYTICYVFGPYCQQAIAVSKCESGRSMSVNASNGQYLGMFQMGSSERRLYGHGNTAIEQTKAAYRYFVASGKDWSPWSCKPY